MCLILNHNLLLFSADSASGQFRVPENLSLDSCGISSAGPLDELTEMCSNVVELDLSDNSIASWDEVSFR